MLAPSTGVGAANKVIVFTSDKLEARAEFFLEKNSHFARPAKPANLDVCLSTLTCRRRRRLRLR